MIKCNLNQAKRQTAYGPLCAKDYLTQKEILKPLEQVHIPQKTVKHSPKEKLVDALIGILASCSALAHNLLVWFKRWFLVGTEAAKLGMERLVKEFLAIPGQVQLGRPRLYMRLPTLHPWAKAFWKGVRVGSPQSG